MNDLVFINNLILFLKLFLSFFLIFFFAKILFGIIKPNLFPKLFLTDVFIYSLYYSIIPLYIISDNARLMDPASWPYHRQYMAQLIYGIPALYNILKYIFLEKKYQKLKTNFFYLFIEYYILAWISASIIQAISIIF